MPKHILWAEGIRTMDCVHFGLSCCLRLAQMFAICCCHRWRWEISNKYYFQSWLHIVLVLIFIFERILCQLSLWRAFQVFAKALDCKHFVFFLTSRCLWALQLRVECLSLLKICLCLRIPPLIYSQTKKQRAMWPHGGLLYSTDRTIKHSCSWNQMGLMPGLVLFVAYVATCINY